MMLGCPKEIKNHEYRVGLTPGSAKAYVDAGHDVFLEADVTIG
jgi:alanine dehydrogenase